jgi:FkbM family methyltransferase
LDTEGVPEADWTPPFTLEERLKYALTPGPLYIRYRAFKEFWRGEREVRVLRDLADRARNSLDVGAQKGVYSYFLARHSRHVYAFEPNPKNFAVLRRNLGRRVTVSPLALSNRSGPAMLRVPRRASGYSSQGASLSSVKVSDDDDHRVLRVQAMRIDDLEIPDIGFIKIDVEGFEAEVLEGAAQTLARDRPVLLVELEERHVKRPIEAAIGDIEALGYRARILRDGRLLDLSHFDPERHHRAPQTRADYIFNFIFLPEPTG